jgi:transcriptional regulator with XRE-family HTH domain
MSLALDKYDTKEFFLAALKKELASMGHGGQARTARHAGVSRSLLNDILKGRIFGAEEKRRAIAAALGYDDYEAFLDIGRSLMKVSAVRNVPEPVPVSALSCELIELLRENRKLRREVDALKTELETAGCAAPPL